MESTEFSRETLATHYLNILLSDGVINIGKRIIIKDGKEITENDRITSVALATRSFTTKSGQEYSLLAVLPDLKKDVEEEDVVKSAHRLILLDLYQILGAPKEEKISLSLVANKIKNKVMSLFHRKLEKPGNFAAFNAVQSAEHHYQKATKRKQRIEKRVFADMRDITQDIVSALSLDVVYTPSLVRDQESTDIDSLGKSPVPLEYVDDRGDELAALKEENQALQRELDMLRRNAAAATLCARAHIHQLEQKNEALLERSKALASRINTISQTMAKPQTIFSKEKAAGRKAHSESFVVSRKKEEPVIPNTASLMQAVGVPPSVISAVGVAKKIFNWT